MNFTREPIIETIVTPKEGFKLVLRNSKGTNPEEYFVDSVQIILIGNNCFYRSFEKPKPFLLPAQDYEIFEVRETKMVMKLPAAEKVAIKIGGGKTVVKPVSEEEVEKPAEEAPQERNERRRDRRRMRRQKDRFEKEETTDEKPIQEEEQPDEKASLNITPPNTLIPPPNTLISETIARYKDIPGFASAFFERKEESFESVEERIENGAVSGSLPSDEERS